MSLGSLRELIIKNATNFKTAAIISGGVIIASLSYLITTNTTSSLITSLPLSSKQRQLQEYINRLESEIYSSLLVNQLLNDPSYIHERGYERISPDKKAKHFTAGTLRGKGKLTIPPIIFRSSEKMESIVLLHLGGDLCGHDNIVHGGLLSTIMDEALAIAVIPSLPERSGATAFLHVNFRKPCKANQIVVCKCRTTKIEGRKGFVEGSLETLDEGVVLVEANALFISLKKLN